MNDTELHKLARKRVAMKMGFAIHLLVYTLVNGGQSVTISSATLAHSGTSA